MSYKTLIVLALIAVGLTMAALALDARRDTAAAWSRSGDPLFPGLDGRISDAVTLVAESAAGTTTLARGEQGWTVSERGDYAARTEDIARLLMALAGAKRLEPMTSKTERYEKLGLGGFEEEASPTVRLRAENAAGDVLAEIFVGRRRYHGSGESWYVREPDEERTWAVEAKLRAPRGTAEWLATDLLHVARDRMQEVHVVHRDGERVELLRESEDAAGFDIANLPEGREPKTDRTGSSFAGALERLRFQDVLPAAEAALDGEGDVVTTFWTSDGLKVVVQGHELEGEDAGLDCVFSISVDETYAPPVQMGPPVAAEEGEEESGVQPEEEAPKTREEVEAEAAELAAKVEGWVFRIPSWKRSSFVTRMEELLVELPEEEPVEEVVEEPLVDEELEEAVEELPDDPVEEDSELVDEELEDEELVDPPDEDSTEEEEEKEDDGDGS